MLRYDGPVIEFLSKIGDVIILNVLWLLCCIPVVTFGPATIAAHYVALKFVRNEGTSIVGMFFQSFRRNLRQGVILGLLSLLAGVILAADLWLILTGRITFSPPVRLLILACLWLLASLYMIMMLYVWAIMARFDNTVKNTVFHAGIIAIANIRVTLTMLCWDVSLVAVAVLCTAFVPQVAVVLAALGIPGVFIVNAVKLRPLLDGRT
ncbi:MAG: YesL family protein [Lachnospiraceae bacterium]